MGDQDKIIERVAWLIDPTAWDRPRVLDLCTFDGTPSSDWEQRIARESARRVVQGLGLREEHETWGDSGVAIPGPTSVTYTRLVTDWQEDTE